MKEEGGDVQEISMSRQGNEEASEASLASLLSSAEASLHPHLLSSHGLIANACQLADRQLAAMRLPRLVTALERVMQAVVSDVTGEGTSVLVLCCTS